MRAGLPVVLVVLSLGTVAQAVQLRANFEMGRWQNVIEVVSMESPIVDRQALDALRGTLEAPTDATCAGGPTNDLLRDFQEGMIAGFRSGMEGGDCTFGESEVENGTFSNTAVCRPTDSSFEAVTNFRGSYTPTSIGGDFTIDVQRTGSREATSILRVEARFSTRRVGPC